jgi:MYXO-CTERM domain-containing protein
VLLAGFFAFAPPGTLIFLFILAFGIFRDRPFVLVGLLAAALVAAIWLIRRRRSARRTQIPNSKM